MRDTDRRAKRALYVHRQNQRGIYMRRNPEAVRDYVNTLHDGGMSYQTIADETQKILGDRRIRQNMGGVHETTISRLMSGQHPSVHVELARAIMRVEPRITERAHMPAHGTVRRVRALAAQGFGLTVQGEHIGRPHPNIMHRLAQGPTFVYGSTFILVRDMYDELECADPAEYAPKETVRRAKSLAARHGWAAPVYWDWDTIDAAEGFPDWTGECGSYKGYQMHFKTVHTKPCEACKKARTAYEHANKETRNDLAYGVPLR